MKKLAIHGGEPVRTRNFPAYDTYDSNEYEAVKRVLDSRVLSRYLAAWDDDFWGGAEIRKLVDLIVDKYQCQFALAVNSATSGLYAAVGALPIEPGDEIICSPYTMSASAACALAFNAIPVFADIDNRHYCLAVGSVRKNISARTRAIVVPHIFGHPADMSGLMEVAAEYDLCVIEDCAQAPYALYESKPVGTIGDIGVFSLNYHKHIQTGEGGFITTNNETLYNRMALILNHAETVIGSDDARRQLDIDSIVNLIGFNFRLTEIGAALAGEQLKKLDDLLLQRVANCEYLTEKLRRIPGLSLPIPDVHRTYNYYAYAIAYDSASYDGLPRSSFVAALRAELAPTENRERYGVMLGQGYVKPLYLLPAYQQKILYGTKGFPWAANEREICYDRGICPVCEDMHENRLLSTELMTPGMRKQDLDDVVDAFYKVAENYRELLDAGLSAV